MGRGGIPLECRRQPRIDIGLAFGEQAHFQRTAHVDRFHRAEFGFEPPQHSLDVRVEMTAAGDHSQFPIGACLAGTDRRQLSPGFHSECAQLKFPAIAHSADRHMHYAKPGHAVADEGDVDGEFAVALDEFTGAVKGVHQPVAFPVPPFVVIRAW